MEPYKYEIGGKTYYQRKLVLGQDRQLIKLLKGLYIPANADPVSLVIILGDKFSEALGIVLIKEGQPLNEKNPEELTKEIEFELDNETAVRIIEDFFDCNPIALLWEKVGAMLEGIGEKMNQIRMTNFSSFSQKETSPKKKASSGDSALTSANPS